MKNDKLSDLYQIRFPDKELPGKIAIWRVLCRNFFSDYINSSDTVVDVACGYGEFINNIEENRKISIELNRDEEKFLNQDIDFNLCEAT